MTVPYERQARDQGFRRTVARLYEHRCALCGIRMRTPEGHTAVAAAHIIPWSVSQNDDPRNRLALCGLCHWTFDEGLQALAGFLPAFESLESQFGTWHFSAQDGTGGVCDAVF